jgi:integrase
LTKEHLDTFFRAKALADFSPKTRNHFREALRLFFTWAVRKDYLSSLHRLRDAEQMRIEHANTADVQFYTAKEFQLLLESADDHIRPVVAIAGLAGLRLSELLQLTWEDVWRVEGHVEVSRTKSKTRQRRLVEMVPTLKLWLEPHRSRKGKLWAGDPAFGYRANENAFHKRLNGLCEASGVKRKENGLRHSFCTYHFAAYSNEGLTAAQAGNSPAMVHGHYKGLATRAEAEAWFAVAPAKAANIIPLRVAANH